MSKSAKYAAETRERAVRMVFEHQKDHSSQWATIESIASKIGCTAQTLCNWVRQAGAWAEFCVNERQVLQVTLLSQP